jgi:hypothetical protein
MADSEQASESDADVQEKEPPAPPRAWAPRLTIGLAALLALVCLTASHFYYLEEDVLWPLWLSVIAIGGLGAMVKATTDPKAPASDEASWGDAVLAAGALVLIVATLLSLPPSARSTERSEFSSLAAMDAKIDRFLNNGKSDPRLIAAVSFSGFASGSDSLDCEGASARPGLKSMHDALGLALKEGQRPILILIGMTDRVPLGKALQKRYESSAGLAVARAQAVLVCLDARPGARKLVEALQTVRLATGPLYTPPETGASALQAAMMAQDRQVSAFLISLPTPLSGAAVVPASSVVPPVAGLSTAASQERAGRSHAGATDWRFVSLLMGVLGLAALAAMAHRLPRAKSDPAEAPPPELVVPTSWDEAVSHVRDMHEMFAELRTKNFNFFLVIVAAAIAGAAGVTEKTNLMLQYISSLAAAVSCIVFFGIEKRTVQMLGDARAELERIEGNVGVYLSRRDRWVGATDRRRLFTHTSLYAAVFVIVYAAALVSIFLHSPW